MATSHTRARIANMRRDTVMRELVVVADQLAAHQDHTAALLATRLLMWERGRALDPRITNARLAEASDVSEPRVIQLLNKAKAARRG